MAPRFCRSLLVFSLLAFAELGHGECVQEASARSYVQDLFRTWAWQDFWYGDIEGWHYVPNTKAALSLFWNKSVFGFCSFDLQYCASYGLLRGRLDRLLATAVISRGGGGLPERTQAFILEEKPRSVNWDESELNACEMEVNLPELDLRRYWNPKKRPSDFQSVVRMLREMNSNARAKGGKSTPREYVIPFYDPADPALHVFVRSGGKDESAVFFVHDRQTYAWRLGGHYDESEGREKMLFLKDLILRNRMATIEAK